MKMVPTGIIGEGRLHPTLMKTDLHVACRATSTNPVSSMLPVALLIVGLLCGNDPGSTALNDSSHNAFFRNPEMHC